MARLLSRALGGLKPSGPEVLAGTGFFDGGGDGAPPTEQPQIANPKKIAIFQIKPQLTFP